MFTQIRTDTAGLGACCSGLFIGDLSDRPTTFPPINRGLEGRRCPIRNDSTDGVNHTDWGRFTSFTQFLVTKRVFVTSRGTEPPSTQCQRPILKFCCILMTFICLKKNKNKNNLLFPPITWDILKSFKRTHWRSL